MLGSNNHIPTLAESDSFMSSMTTQANNLPIETDGVYHDMLHKKALIVLTDSDTDVEDWLTALDDALRPLGLHNLIDKTMFRPHASDPLYYRWNFWSVAVGWWMRRFLDENMTAHLCLSEDVPMFADDLYLMIESHFGRADSSSHVRQELAKWHEMKLSDYDTAAEFVIAYENSCIILDRFRVGPPPFMALARLLDELKDTLPKVAEIEWELKDKIALEITEASFEEYCKTLIAAAQQMGDC